MAKVLLVILLGLVLAGSGGSGAEAAKRYRVAFVADTGASKTPS